MCASHGSLLWLGETRLNLYLIRLHHRGWHSSRVEALRSLPCLRWMAWLETWGPLLVSSRKPNHQPPHWMPPFIYVIKSCQSMVAKKHLVASFSFFLLVFCQKFWLQFDTVKAALMALVCILVVNLGSGEDITTCRRLNRPLRNAVAGMVFSCPFSPLTIEFRLGSLTFARLICWWPSIVLLVSMFIFGWVY